MKKKHLAYWQAYVDDMRDALRLWTWEVEIVHAPPENQRASASILAEDQRNNAELHLAPDFFDDTPEEQRYMITHELMHLHLWRYMNLTNELAGQMGAQASEFAQVQLTRMLELMNDEIAKAVAPFLPLPPRAKEESA